MTTIVTEGQYNTYMVVELTTIYTATCYYPILFDAYDEPDCAPPQYVSVWYDGGYYSPAICPHNYTIGCTPTKTMSAGQTGGICVPLGWDCGSFQMHATSTLEGGGTTSVPAFQIRWEASDLSILETDPLTPSAQATGSSPGGSGNDSGDSGDNSGSSGDNSNSSGGNSGGGGGGGGISPGAAAGIAVGAAFVVAVIGLLAFFWYRKKHMKPKAAAAGQQGQTEAQVGGASAGEKPTGQETVIPTPPPPPPPAGNNVNANTGTGVQEMDGAGKPAGNGFGIENIYDPSKPDGSYAPPVVQTGPAQQLDGTPVESPQGGHATTPVPTHHGNNEAYVPNNTATGFPGHGPGVVHMHEMPGHGVVGYPQPGYPQPGYPQTGYPQPGYPQAGYPQPGYPGYAGYPAELGATQQQGYAYPQQVPGGAPGPWVQQGAPNQTYEMGQPDQQQPPVATELPVQQQQQQQQQYQTPSSPPPYPQS